MSKRTKSRLSPAKNDLPRAALAALAGLVEDICTAPSPSAAAKRAGVTFEYPGGLRGVVVKVAASPKQSIYFAVAFDSPPPCVVPAARMREIDQRLLDATAALDDAIVNLAAPTESARREAIRTLKALNRALTRAANLTYKLSQTPPAGVLPWRTAAAVFWIDPV